MPASYGSGPYGYGAYGIGKSIDDYLALVTSEHSQQPNFIAFLTAWLQPVIDLQATLLEMVEQFDLDYAAGQQLDFIGQWVGVSRFITVPIPSVFFSFDISGLGFDQGTWFGPGDFTTGLTALPDDSYRVLLRARIAADHWDGTAPGAYTAWAIIFGAGNVHIVDNQNMSINVHYVGPTLNAVSSALFLGGYLGLKPAGVSVTYSIP